ncbi:probable signal peptidase complex subunit 2 [Gigantopelta aegis]|uniref:probable signal peptidase complex subunit 2 n=1 Tax=Gigantopelta aegis TaxID=1735272 RepID=UPI001B88BC34|nr:probable signal peptidase complex subunit 2 [Gigantopelta aegis]
MMGADKSKDSKSGKTEDVKIDKWDTSALKNALDDAAKKVLLDTYGYKESHKLVDCRLFICTIAVGFATFALIWDYLRPFPESRPVLITCVSLSYFVLMGVLTVYTTYCEKGFFLVALEKDKTGVDPDNVWHLSSYLKKYDDIYHLTMSYMDGKTKKTTSAEVSKSVAQFFDEKGYLCTENFSPVVVSLRSTITKEKKEK